MENTVNKRIKFIMQDKNMTQEQFSKLLGISRGRLANVLIGKNNPNFETVVNIIKKNPEYNPMWILTGEGSEYTSQNNMFLQDKVANDDLYDVNAIKNYSKYLKSIFNTIKNHAIEIEKSKNEIYQLKLEIETFEENLVGVIDEKVKLAPVLKKMIDDRVRSIVAQKCIVNGTDKE